jgi:nucleoside-diphosphate-sugar epimerase
MKVLFIGGTGVISSACAELALARGIDLYLLNRGKNPRPVPHGAKLILGDISQPEKIRELLQKQTFDVVVDWICFSPDQAKADIRSFQGKTRQFIFISSASAYQTPPAKLPVTEETPLENPFWEYSRQKIACERYFMQAFRETGFPITIVRPSHTYDCTKIPLVGGFTTLDRMQRGKKIIVHGDGTSIWALTHSRDFAKGLVGLLGQEKAVGEAFHITSDELLTWNQIYLTMAEILNVEPQLVHIPSDFIAQFDPVLGAGLLGDKTQSMLFDNSKIKKWVPDFQATVSFKAGAREIIDWYAADPARQVIDPHFEQLFETILVSYAVAWER